ncbi:UNVERIFIED_CONTAM: hypothetical protein RMT77_005932 [Armadillidium vulgare]
MQQNSEFKLIYNGQILDKDQKTLKDYELHENCILHCQILKPEGEFSQQSQEIQEYNFSNRNDITELQLNYEYIFLIILILWYEFGHFVTHHTTLVAIVFILLVFIFSNNDVHISFDVSLEQPSERDDEQNS